MDLFKQSEDEAVLRNAPLAVRMRPRTVEEVLGQDDFLGPGKLLRRMLEVDRITRLIFHGPPGTGKTTLAHVIARRTNCAFHALDAASASVKDVRKIIAQARALLTSTDRRTIVFIDELHRFSRSQQDVLLKDVESGVIVLIGATTENPFFTIKSPLLSRSTIFRFSTLTEEDIVTLLHRALADKQRGLGAHKVRATDEALAHLATIAVPEGNPRITTGPLAFIPQPIAFCMKSPPHETKPRTGSA